MVKRNYLTGISLSLVFLCMSCPGASQKSDQNVSVAAPQTTTTNTTSNIKQGDLNNITNTTNITNQVISTIKEDLNIDVKASDLKYESTDTSIAVVDENGNVTPVGSGEVGIKIIRISDGKVLQTFKTTVTSPLAIGSPKPGTTTTPMPIIGGTPTPISSGISMPTPLPSAGETPIPAPTPTISASPGATPKPTPTPTATTTATVRADWFWSMGQFGSLVGHSSSLV